MLPVRNLFCQFSGCCRNFLFRFHFFIGRAYVASRIAYMELFVNFERSGGAPKPQLSASNFSTNKHKNAAPKKKKNVTCIIQFSGERIHHKRAEHIKQKSSTSSAPNDDGENITKARRGGARRMFSEQICRGFVVFSLRFVSIRYASFCTYNFRPEKPLKTREKRRQRILRLCVCVRCACVEHFC